MRVLVLYLITASVLARRFVAERAHEHTMPGQTSMPGMEMPSSTPDWMPGPASSGTGWQPAVTPAHLWTFGGWDLMAHGVVFLDYNQQGGPRRGREGGVSQLADVDGTASVGTRHDFVSPDVFGGVADFAPPWIPRTVSNRRNLSRSAARRSPASAQCFCRTVALLHASHQRQNLLVVLWRTGCGAGAGSRGIHASGFGGRIADGPAFSPPAGFYSHRFRSGDDGFDCRSIQDRRFGLQWP